MTSRDGGQQAQPPQGMQPGTAQAYAAMGVQPQAVAYDDEIPF